MIKTKIDLKFYIMADRIMNGYPASQSILTRVKESLFIGGPRTIIIKYLYHLRRYSYFLNNHRRNISWNSLLMIWERYRVSKLGIKCGFSIGANSLDYGVILPHYGTVVINAGARIGRFAVIHTSTCIAGGDKNVGEGLYLGTGSQIVGKIEIGDNVTIASHSLVNKSFGSNVLLVGSPADIKKNDYSTWYERDGAEYVARVKSVLQLKEIFYA